MIYEKSASEIAANACYGPYGAACLDGTAPLCNVGDKWSGYVVTAEFFQQLGGEGVKAVVRAKEPSNVLPGLVVVCEDNIRDLRAHVFWIDYALYKMSCAPISTSKLDANGHPICRVYHS